MVMSSIPTDNVTMTYCMLGMVLVVSCIKGFKIIRIISDKDWNVAAMFHQILLVLRLKVTTPLGKKTN